MGRLGLQEGQVALKETELSTSEKQKSPAVPRTPGDCQNQPWHLLPRLLGVRVANSPDTAEPIAQDAAAGLWWQG